MPGAATAEIIFITAMMALILIISFTAVFFFFKTYTKEKRERAAKSAPKPADVENRIENELKSES